jgi:dTMP kinase
MLVAIEGLDSSGKATQAKILAERMDAALFAFPRYLTTVGQVIKQHLLGNVALMYEHVIDSSDHTIDSMGVNRRDTADPLMFQALMLADKYDAAVAIRRHLSAGRHVICDRWIPSSQCYGTADGLDSGWLDRMHASLPIADLSIFLAVSPEEALRRRPEARDRYERDREKQAVVRANYEYMWSENMADPLQADRWARVDGEAPVEEVTERIWACITRRASSLRVAVGLPP